MDKAKIVSIISLSLQEYLESRDETADINLNTYLVGRKSVLDSIGLVNLIVDIESKLLDEGYEISLLSEKAMSQSSSPFKNIDTLSDFILEEISGQ
ncbi:hypothetical protein MASR1M45_09540 [Candidatus Kapaibacterium sp.]